MTNEELREAVMSLIQEYREGFAGDDVMRVKAAVTIGRLLDEMREAHGRLDTPVPTGEEGGTVRVELNHVDTSGLPSGFRLGDNDTRILAVARNLADEGYTVTLVNLGPSTAQNVTLSDILSAGLTLVSASGNNEVLFAWLELALANRYEPAVPLARVNSGSSSWASL